jgi:hypothetical protein
MHISRRKFLAAASATAVITGTPSLPSAAPVPLAAARKQAAGGASLGKRTLLGTAIETGMFKNLALTLTDYQSAAGYAYPAILDENGYPTSIPIASIYGLVQLPSNLTPSTQLVLKWTGLGTIQLGRGAPGFSLISGSSFVTGGTSFNLTVAGTNARVVFSFVGSVPTSVALGFVAGAKFAGLSNVVLCRLSDEAAIDQATTPEEMFDDNYVSVYQSLNLGTVRPMGCTNPNGGNVSQARYLAPWRTAINICTQRWAPGAWAGVTSGTNNYTCAAQRDATSSYVDGEMIQLQFANANTSSAVTVKSGGRGLVPVVVGFGGNTCQPPTIGQIAAGSLATLTYDAVLGAFMWQQGGQWPSLPYELQIAFANRINADYWCNFATYMDDASVSSITKLVRDKLRATLNAYFEYGNEIWNYGYYFPATTWADAKGAALGFPADNNRRLYGWYGLRVRQMMGLVTTAWSPRPIAQLKRVMAFHVVGAPDGTSKYRFQGVDLSGAAYPQYASKRYPDYNVEPNRPIDYCDVLSYATYYAGAQCTNFDANYLYHGAAAIAGLLAAADDYASAVPSKMASALVFMDNDVRAGTLSGSGIKGDETLLTYTSGAYGVGVYPMWEALAATFNKSVECYEGGYESWYPSTQTCTALGISTAYGGPTGKIAKLLEAFKMSPAFGAVVRDQIVQFMAQPHSKSAAWLLLPGSNQWGLSSGDAFQAKYKSWDAIVAFNR